MPAVDATGPGTTGPADPGGEGAGAPAKGGLAAGAPARLSFFDLACIGLAGIIGAGIFIQPSDLARLLGGLSPLAFLVAAASTIPITLCFAEMSSRTERSGGPYDYARRTFGPRLGFGVGWLVFASVCVSWPAVAQSIPPYLAVLWPGFDSPGAAHAVGALLVLLTGAVNFFGLRSGAGAIDLLTLGKALPLLLLAVVGLLRLPETAAPAPVVATPTNFARAWFLAMFAMSGFELVPLPAGESHDPRRNVPRALLASVGAAALLQIVLQWIAVRNVPGLAGSAHPLADTGAAVLGPFGSKLIAAAGVVSMLSFISSSAFLAPRALATLAEHGDLPAVLGRHHGRFGTPSIAIVATTVLAAGLASTVSFADLVDLSILTTLAQYLPTCLAVWLLLGRADVAPPRFRLPGGRLTILAAVLVTLRLAWEANITAVAAMVGFLILGYGLRFVLRGAPAGDSGT